jgi:hypothetical protein
MAKPRSIRKARGLGRRLETVYVLSTSGVSHWTAHVTHTPLRTLIRGHGPFRPIVGVTMVVRSDDGERRRFVEFLG